MGQSRANQGCITLTPRLHHAYNAGNRVTGATNADYMVTGTALGDRVIGVVITNVHGFASGTSLLTVIPLPADPFETSVLALHPVGYWPLQETYAPAPVTLETNYGTLGSLGDAFYAMNAGASPRVTFGQNGALGNSGDYDTAVAFAGNGGALGTNYAFVPHAAPALTLKAPLTFEAWLYSANTATFCDIMGQGGNGVNTPAGGSGSWRGIRMSYGGNVGGGPNLQVYAYQGGVNNYVSFGTPANSLPVNQWHHCVMTFDGTNGILYVDGLPQATSSNISAMVPDVCSPLTIGDGRWLGDAGGYGATRSFIGTLDEVAVYTNALVADRIWAHYVAGTTATASNYVAAVQADSPLLYYRMDSTGYITPDPGTYPPAINYGSAPVNGAYPGGILPGGVPGPSILGLGTSLAAPGNGVISCVDAGDDPAFNPTNSQPFSALLCFKGYPCDGRAQTLMSHGANNWAMNLEGSTGRIVWNLYSGGQVTSTNILNDGTWHMVAGVFDGTSSYLYVDGALNSSAVVTSGLVGEPGADLFLGGNADYTSVGVNQRYFAGAIAQAALFTNALTAPQIQYLYNLALVVPSISLQRVGNNLVITYTGALLSSSNVVGPYTPVAGASSPYTVPQTAAQRFYRTQGHL